MQTWKCVIHNVAHAFGKTRKTGNQYADLSQRSLYCPAMDKNLYDLPLAELAQVPTVCGSLQEAIDSLAADHDYLTKGNVFSKDQIESYLELKQEEQDRYRMTPHPVEYDMYYSC
jgi:glutamine synthetase